MGRRPNRREAGACNGDSGAPIWSADGSTAIAIVAWAQADGRGCGGLTQGPLLAPLRTWIKETEHKLLSGGRSRGATVYIGHKLYKIAKSTYQARSHRGETRRHAREAPDALRFYAELQQRTSVAACSALFKKAIAVFEIVAFACGEIDLADRDRNVMFIAEWPEAWLQFYVKSGFINRDPVVNALAFYRKPFSSPISSATLISRRESARRCERRPNMDGAGAWPCRSRRWKPSAGDRVRARR